MTNQFCDCNGPGWCPRYQRIIGRRHYEICSAINCDLGESANYREIWRNEVFERIPFTEKEIERAKELARQGKITITINEQPTHLLLKNYQQPGDVLVMTAAIYSLHRKYPGKYITHVDTPYPEIFKYNPDVAEGPTNIEGIIPIEMHYPAVHQSNQRGIHFMSGWCEHLGASLGVNVPLMTNRPRLYFSKSLPEMNNFWVVCSGGKNDLTNKLWGHEKYQRVVDTINHYTNPIGGVKFIQVGGNKEDHPPLRNTFSNLVGMTPLRRLFDIIQLSRGVLCGVSLPMHIAAALEKPCIVIAGGREPVQWNAYPNQHYLHTVGVLPCTDARNEPGPCWRSRVLPQGDNRALDENPCLYPIQQRDVTLPKCMTLIKPETVADLILTIDKELQ